MRHASHAICVQDDGTVSVLDLMSAHLRQFDIRAMALAVAPENGVVPGITALWPDGRVEGRTLRGIRRYVLELPVQAPLMQAMFAESKRRVATVDLQHDVAVWSTETQRATCLFYVRNHTPMDLNGFDARGERLAYSAAARGRLHCVIVPTLPRMRPRLLVFSPRFDSVGSVSFSDTAPMFCALIKRGPGARFVAVGNMHDDETPITLLPRRRAHVAAFDASGESIVLMTPHALTSRDLLAAAGKRKRTIWYNHALQELDAMTLPNVL